MLSQNSGRIPYFVVAVDVVRVYISCLQINIGKSKDSILKSKHHLNHFFVSNFRPKKANKPSIKSGQVQAAYGFVDLMLKCPTLFAFDIYIKLLNIWFLYRVRFIGRYANLEHFSHTESHITKKRVTAFSL